MSAHTTPTPYVYRALVLSVYDGDSITVMLDMGMGVQRKTKCRLLGIDTPEIRTKSATEKAAGITARDRLRELILDQEVTIHSVAKPDKYGRVLINIWSDEHGFVNKVLLDEGHAIDYSGGTKIAYASWT